LEAQARGWATPQSHDACNPKTPEQVAAMQRSTGAGVSNLNEQATAWRSPRAAEASHGGRTKAKPQSTLGTAEQASGHHRPTTCTHGEPCKPTLNPRFVEWLMGFPIGWTAFEPLETEWSRWLRLMRSEFWRLGLPSEGRR
jgi:DNA (cytosine-5)-methyltransferase 1